MKKVIAHIRFPEPLGIKLQTASKSKFIFPDITLIAYQEEDCTEIVIDHQRPQYPQIHVLLDHYFQHSILPVLDAKKILCLGYGYYSKDLEILAKKYPNGTIYGYEQDDTNTTFATENHKNNSRIQPDYQFNTSSSKDFDLVVFRHINPYDFTNLQSALEEYIEALKIGGCLVITTYFRSECDKILTALKQVPSINKLECRESEAYAKEKRFSIENECIGSDMYIIKAVKN